MRNKGFTLVELLAVIVILAVIALIATPIIIGVIKDVKEEAKLRSQENVYTSVRYAYTVVGIGLKDSSLTPTLEKIANKIEIDNAEVSLDDETNPTKILIETKDEVNCTVTGNNEKGFLVECDAGLRKELFPETEEEGTEVPTEPAQPSEN